MTILTLNAGSSSLKFALFRQNGAALSRGQIENIPDAPHLVARDTDGTLLSEQSWESGRDWHHEDFLGWLLDWVDAHLGDEALKIAGHRVVHGGAEFAEPIRVSETLLPRLEALCHLAPLHQKHNLAPIRAIARLRPDLPQIACFDTAFHLHQPAVASRLPLPAHWRDKGLRRYGFHGLSYEFIAGRLAELAPHLAKQKLVLAHLGNGASLCALEDGRSIDSSMSFTALDGLIMGSRCGSIDPGVLLHLLQQEGMSPAALADLLYHRSGLLGLSGESADMRVLLESPNQAARDAIDSFIYRALREIGALTATLGGLQGLIFTAGIGEHAPLIRARIVKGLGWLGARLAPERNLSNLGRISSDDSTIEIWVIPTDEEAMIARHARDLIGD